MTKNMEYPDRVKDVADVGNSASLDDVAAQGYSFPSMHSASIMALCISLAREVRKRWMWILAVVIIFLADTKFGYGIKLYLPCRSGVALEKGGMVTVK